MLLDKPMQMLLVRSVLAFYRVHSYSESLVNRCLLALMPDSFIKALSDAAYLSERYGHRDWNEQGLFAWEKSFVDEHIGQEARRILVPGCGGGREALHLARSGHEVVAFDPVVPFLETCRRMVDAEDLPVRLFEGGYEDLVEPPGGARRRGGGFPSLTPAAIERAGPYDAVLFGWGSINHVLSMSTLERAIAFLGGPAVCPRGSMLLSFWVREPHARGSGRVGSLLGRIGRRGEKEILVKGLYGRYFSREDIESLASRSGLRVLETSWETPGRFDPYSSFAVLGRVGGAEEVSP